MKQRKQNFFLTRLCPVACLMAAFLIPAKANSTAEEQFKKANASYQKGNYEEAIEQYEAIIRSGYVSPEVYFNLGNAYYKTSNIPAAILNYERSLKLSPGNDDAQFNLQLANSQTIDKIEPLPEVFYKKWINKKLMESTPEKRLKWVIILLWICFVLAACWLFIPVRWIRQLAFSLAVVSLLGSLFFYSMAIWQQKQLQEERFAIIFQSNVYVKSSPDEKSANLFMLHGGTKVKMIDELSGWKRIRLPNGHEGWIEGEALQHI